MSDLSTTPSTELDAVNMMLLSIGQTPVNTVDVTGIRDVSIAKMHLDNNNRETQSAGWYFNREKGVVIVPDVDGHINVADNVLFIEPSDRNQFYVQRGDAGVARMYDLDNHTFVFDATRTYKFDIIYIFDFDDLPQDAKTYIARKAAMEFQAKAIGSQILFSFDMALVNSALTTLRRNETRRKGSNIFRGPDPTNRIIYRR